MAALMFVGCKPTEKNYKAAYDAALSRRQEVAQEQMRPATGLLSDDGPQMRIVGGDTVYVLRERLRLTDGTRVPGKWCVGVGVFVTGCFGHRCVGDRHYICLDLTKYGIIVNTCTCKGEESAH